jgi:hypothetical protein
VVAACTLWADVAAAVQARVVSGQRATSRSASGLATVPTVVTVVIGGSWALKLTIEYAAESASAFVVPDDDARFGTVSTVMALRG